MSTEPSEASTPPPRLVRAPGRRGAALKLTIDGEPATAVLGDTVLVAVLTNRASLRVNEHDGKPRAGFCLMGACQDCWVWLGDGRRIRACTTPATEGLAVLTRPPEGYPRHA